MLLFYIYATHISETLPSFLKHYPHIYAQRLHLIRFVYMRLLAAIYDAKKAALLKQPEIFFCKKDKKLRSPEETETDTDVAVARRAVAAAGYATAVRVEDP